MKKLFLFLSVLLFVVFSLNGTNNPMTERTTQVTYEELYKEILNNKIMFPEIVFAQAVLESGHFSSELYHTANNLFGMKMPKRRPTLSIMEEQRGFAVYEDWTYSVKDYGLWQDYVLRHKKSITEKHYFNLLDRTYAKNKNYSKILRKIINNFSYIFEKEAEVAHSVEHDLAKVGVASSSLVFRSTSPSSSAGRATDL